MMRRREFIALVGAAAAGVPLAAHAQPSGKLRRIGVLVDGTGEDPENKARLAGFLQGLDGFGWSEGRNVQIELRFTAGGTEQRTDPYQALAKELVALRPDVIFSWTTATTAALQRESRRIPIVFGAVSDPIGLGFITSLARPGGNLTGLLNFEPSITGKWLAMLKQIAPRVTRAALLGNPKTISYDYFLRPTEAAAGALAIELVPSRVENVAAIERAIESFARVPNGGLVLPPDPTTIAHRDLVIALAAQYRLPAVYAYRLFADAGGLMSYSTDVVDLYRRAASHVDRILRGAKAGDLPVQAPTKFETVINSKTAKALGLTVPPALLAAANAVIE